MSNKFKAVIIADSHLKNVDKYGIKGTDGINSRLVDNLQGLEKSVRFALENKVDYWIHLGDVFHKINPEERLRNLFFKTIAPLLGKIPVIIVVGNHDTNMQDVHSLMTDHNVLNTLNDGWFKVIDEPIPVKLNGVKCLLIPWTHEDKIASILKNYEDTYIFGHFQVKGAQPSGTEFILREGITPSLFNKHHMAFLGHYHKIQSANHWMYVGSTHKIDMGERGQKKRFLYLKVDNEEWETTNIYIDEREFIQIELRENEELKDIDFKGAVIKLVLSGSKTWIYSQDFNQIKRDLFDRGAFKVFIDTKVIRGQTIEGKPLDYKSVSSWDIVVGRFAKLKGAEGYIKFGQQIFKEDIEN